MKTLRSTAVVAIIIWLSAPIASAQSLWNATEYGMSVEQVKAAIPDAVLPQNRSHLGDGSEELLRLENVEIVNNKFAARFYFRAAKLSQVTLTLEKGHTFHSALLVFNSLTEALRAKYGSEINRQMKRGVMNVAEATWISGRTNIAVLALAVGENDATLNVNYQVRVARDADKL